MKTSRSSHTFKRVKHLINKFLSKSESLSKPSAHKAESDTPISQPPRTKAIHAFGILGITGPLCTVESGGMTTDFAAWQFLISHMKGYKSERTIWLPIRPINHLFPDGSVVFGETECDQLRLPLPITSETDLGPKIRARHFTIRCLYLLQEMARNVKPGETLVLVLIGYGALVDGEFRFFVTTHTDKIIGEAYINKAQLEEALAPCYHGDILVICNSSNSGHLASEHWTLLCSATPEQEAEALSRSHPAHFRGSNFTACAVAQAAHEHGLRVPLPRADPEKQPASLPPPPLPRSFSIPVAQLSSIKPPKIPLADFVGHMTCMKEFLVENLISIFQVEGPKSMVSWTNIFPVDFTADIVVRMSVRADLADFVIIHNLTFPGHGLPGDPLPAPASHQINPLLVKLASAMPDSSYTVHTLDGVYTKAAEDLRRHIAEPERYAFPLEDARIGKETLRVILHSRNVQAVAVQYIARELGWCTADPADPVMAFIPQRLMMISNSDLDDMIESGIKVNSLSSYLRDHHFPGARTVTDRPSARWLWLQWDAAGRPAIPDSAWDEVLEKVGIMTEREAIQ